MSTGTIHDLGYKRYAGVRRDAGTRWRVIMRHQIAMAWKTWWRFKSWLGMAVLISFIAGAFMYSTEVFGHFGRVGTVALMIRDIALPESFGWYAKAAFLASLTLGATVIAGDLQSGAFTFYFARSVRPRDYVIGKLAGLGVMMAILTMAGPFLLACMRLGLCESWSDALAHIAILPKALAVGALAAIVYAAVPLAFSAIADSRRTALAMWAAYYLVGGFIAMMVGALTHSGWVAALDLHSAIDGVAERLFEIPNLPGKHLAPVSLAAGLTSIVVQVGAASARVWGYVGRAQRSGVGGST